MRGSELEPVEKLFRIHEGEGIRTGASRETIRVYVEREQILQENGFNRQIVSGPCTKVLHKAL